MQPYVNWPYCWSLSRKEGGSGGQRWNIEAWKEVKRGGDGGVGWTNDWDKAPACWHNDGLAGSHIAVFIYLFIFNFTNNSDLIKGPEEE